MHSKDTSTKYKIYDPDQMCLNGNYLIASSKKADYIKIWNLETKKKILELDCIEVQKVEALGNGFIYTTLTDENLPLTRNFYRWSPDLVKDSSDDESQLVNTYNNFIDFSTFDGYIAIANHLKQIEIYTEDFKKIRTIQLDSDTFISKIQLSGPHIFYQAKKGVSCPGGFMLGDESDTILTFNSSISSI